MKTILMIVTTLVVLLVGTLVLTVTFGGPNEPPPMASINDPFSKVDFSTMPALDHFVARDGMKLAYRAYPVVNGSPLGSVVLVHGSSSRGSSMHALAKTFATAGYMTYALDIRGHGDSGTKGYIDYVGQLEDDLEDFCQTIRPSNPSTLAGFSSGGGFVLRFAGDPRQGLFSNYLLLSPFISQDAPTYRPNSGGWVSVGIPRIIALSVLNGIGVKVFNELPVIKFALAENAKTFLTPQYSYTLAQNFRPQYDYLANIRAVTQPISLVAGQADDVFYADHFTEVFKAAGKDIPITLLPGIDHISLILEPSAMQAAVTAVRNMNHSP